MANDRRDKPGLAHQFEKLKQQILISLTPTAIAQSKREAMRKTPPRAIAIPYQQSSVSSGLM